MFGWRRRSEGFEWREYVRTTVLVRRADRQRRVDDVRMAAIAKAKGVANASAEAGRAGAVSGGVKFVNLLSMLGSALLDLTVAAWHVAVRWASFLFAVVADLFGGAAQPFVDTLRAPARAAREKVKFLPDVASKSPVKPRHVAMVLGALAVIYFGGPILRSADGVAVATFTPDASSSSALTASSELSGRAYAVAGDLLSVGGTLVRLDGVEAPLDTQTCFSASGRKRACASAARSSLDRLLRGRLVTCSATGHDAQGNPTAKCLVDGSKDVAAELVRSGQLFAVKSMFNPLTGDEDEARAAKAGLWQSDVVRPQEWRDQTWEDAKRDAPGGCPIKGIVRSSSKFYALPWSGDYARARMRPERGDQWFCSEDDAKAAGFLPSSSGS